jgi:UDP-2-acetamido-3-amino-2,3-dideoxy-glucuronate N-acetyltransferase
MYNRKNMIHPSSFIDKGARVGKGAKIWHNVHVASTAVIGKNCIIGQNCYIAGVVGDNCRIQNNVNVYQGVELGKWVFCGPSMTFTNDPVPRVKYPKQGNFVKTFVGDGVSFGAHSTILCGLKIGKWAFIGAGSVVTKDVPPYALVYGNPARQHGWVNRKGAKVVKQPKL